MTVIAIEKYRQHEKQKEEKTIKVREVRWRDWVKLGIEGLKNLIRKLCRVDIASEILQTISNFTGRGSYFKKCSYVRTLFSRFEKAKVAELVIDENGEWQFESNEPQHLSEEPEFFIGKYSNYSDLRQEYAIWSLELHPDYGGNAKDFNRMNAEYLALKESLKLAA